MIFFEKQERQNTDQGETLRKKTITFDEEKQCLPAFKKAIESCGPSNF
jgi:hypothetical protein